MTEKSKKVKFVAHTKAFSIELEKWIEPDWSNIAAKDLVIGDIFRVVTGKLDKNKIYKVLSEAKLVNGRMVLETETIDDKIWFQIKEAD